MKRYDIFKPYRRIQADEKFGEISTEKKQTIEILCPTKGEQLFSDGLIVEENNKLITEGKGKD